MTSTPGMRALRAFGLALCANLLQGARLACGLPRPRFDTTLAQLLALLAIGWAIAFGVDWQALERAAPSVSTWGLATDAARAYWWLAAVALIALLDGAPRSFLTLAVACAAADPLLWACWLGALALLPRLPMAADWPVSELLWQATLVWQSFVMLRALRLTQPRFRWRLPLLAASYGCVLYAMAEYLPDEPLLEASVSPSASTPIDVEGTYYAQSALLEQALATLAPGRPGRPDMWFLGFGSYAGEAVFRREVMQVRDIVATQFDTAGRSLLLVNSRRTLDSLPLANRSNLDYLLRHLGQRMERDEDILFLFLTSHGREDGKLVVDFDELGLHDLTPAQLRTMLDAAGIRWRVLVVSACFSGAFLPALKEAHTLVITAAAQDRSSFGCAHENEWTYFGEAFFRDALPRNANLEEAFMLARTAIETRERSEGKTPSLPQIARGEEIGKQLERWAELRD